MDPTLNGALFYFENIALTCGFLFISMMLAFGNGPVRSAMIRWEPEVEPGPRYKLRKFARWVRVNQSKIGAFLLVFFGARFSLVIGVHAAVGVAAIQQGGLAWYLHTIRIVQAVGLGMLLRGLRKKRKYPNPPPELQLQK